jgi:hypothetical protein
MTGSNNGDINYSNPHKNIQVNTAHRGKYNYSLKVMILDNRHSSIYNKAYAVGSVYNLLPKPLTNKDIEEDREYGTATLGPHV